jgi:hypothetical protein
LVGLALLSLVITVAIWIIGVVIYASQDYNSRYNFALVDNDVPTTTPDVNRVAQQVERLIYNVYGVNGIAKIDKEYHGGRDYDASDGVFKAKINGETYAYKVGSHTDAFSRRLMIQWFQYAVPADVLGANFTTLFQRHGFKILSTTYEATTIEAAKERPVTDKEWQQVNFIITYTDTDTIQRDFQLTASGYQPTDDWLKQNLGFIKTLPGGFRFTFLNPVVQSDGQVDVDRNQEAPKTIWYDKNEQAVVGF